MIFGLFNYCRFDANIIFILKTEENIKNNGINIWVRHIMMKQCRFYSKPKTTNKILNYWAILCSFILVGEILKIKKKWLIRNDYICGSTWQIWIHFFKLYYTAKDIWHIHVHSNYTFLHSDITISHFYFLFTLSSIYPDFCLCVRKHCDSVFPARFL